MEQLEIQNVNKNRLHKAVTNHRQQYENELPKEKCAAHNTYVFKPVFAELHHEVEKDQGGEPQTPHHHLFHRLHVQDPEDENKLIEDEIPEFIFQVLRNKTHSKSDK